MQTLTQMQEETLRRMAEQRTSERRAARNRAAAIRQYRKQVEAIGYPSDQVSAQISDLWDMHRLRANADEADDPCPTCGEDGGTSCGAPSCGLLLGGE